MSVDKKNTLLSQERETSVSLEKEFDLEDTLATREALVLKAKESGKTLRQLYRKPDGVQENLMAIEEMQKAAFQEIEKIDQKICAYSPKNIDEKKLKLIALLEICILLNDLEASDENVQLLRDNIEAL